MVSVFVLLFFFKLQKNAIYFHAHIFLRTGMCVHRWEQETMCGGHVQIESSGSAGKDLRMGTTVQGDSLLSVTGSLQQELVGQFVRLCFWLEIWVPAPAWSAPAWVTVKTCQARGHPVPHLPQGNPASKPESCCSVLPGYGSCQCHLCARSRPPNECDPGDGKQASPCLCRRWLIMTPTWHLRTSNLPGLSCVLRSLRP